MLKVGFGRVPGLAANVGQILCLNSTHMRNTIILHQVLQFVLTYELNIYYINYFLNVYMNTSVYFEQQHLEKFASDLNSKNKIN